MSPNDRPNGGGRSGQPYRPMTIDEIAKQADVYKYDPRVPFKYWVGALESLYREGMNYTYDGSYAKAYMLLLRHASLFLKDVSTHPDAKQPENRRLLKPIKNRIPHVFNQLEVIKPLIEEAHREWVEITGYNKDATASSPDSPSSSYDAFAARDAALSWNSKSNATLIDANNNQELAVELATKELERRGASRRAGREAYIYKEPDGYQPRHRGGRSSYSAPRNDEASNDDISQQMEAIRWQLDKSQQPARTDDDAPVIPVSYNYPSISKSTPVSYERPAPEAAPVRPIASRPQPPRPPKSSLPDYGTRRDAPDPPKRVEQPPKVPPRPLRPGDLRFDDSALSNSRNHETVEPSPIAPKLPPKTLASPPRTEKRVTFKPAAYLENGDPIRPIFLPEGLRKEFLQIASKNTARKIETCGLLCGNVVNNALFVTTLLIPEQKGTSDMCETTDEPAIFEFMDKEELISLGWIHTHPTQTCFMSSRDLHTQAGYQVMMPESIAIVCAPKYDPSWGVFRLTNPPGLPLLLNCKEEGTFHPHDVPAEQLYIDAEHPPGHVYLAKQMSFTVHDLRSP